jgi:hypothetical protein
LQDRRLRNDIISTCVPLKEGTIFRTTTDGVTWIEDGPVVGRELPTTTVRDGLPHNSIVQLTVFKPLGQQVAVLQKGEQEATYHRVRFDGSGLSNV